MYNKKILDTPKPLYDNMKTMQWEKKQGLVVIGFKGLGNANLPLSDYLNFSVPLPREYQPVTPFAAEGAMMDIINQFRQNHCRINIFICAPTSGNTLELIHSDVKLDAVSDNFSDLLYAAVPSIATNYLIPSGILDHHLAAITTRCPVSHIVLIMNNKTILGELPSIDNQKAAMLLVLGSLPEMEIDVMDISDEITNEVILYTIIPQ